MSGWREGVARRVPASRVRFDVPLRELTTLRIGGPADCVVDLESEADLLTLVPWLEQAGVPVLLLGKGSNLLADDGGLRGVVLRLGRGLSVVTRLEGGDVWAGAGIANAAYVSRCREWGLGGMEFLVAIPGTIGGAIAMNAGAHDGETAAFLQRVRYYERGAGVREQPASAFAFAYRTSPLRGQGGRIVLGGAFRMTPMPVEAIREREAGFQRYRRETQPREFPNCGSVFKNPPGDHAGALIERCGLKGHRLGGAQVSDKHANFIVNTGGASAADVLQLIDLLQETVYQQAGVRLDLEMQIVDAEGRFRGTAGV